MKPCRIFEAMVIDMWKGNPHGYHSLVELATAFQKHDVNVIRNKIGMGKYYLLGSLQTSLSIRFDDC